MSCSNEKLCTVLDYDDSACANIGKCCVGIENQGDHARCTSAMRGCQKFGSVWEPRRPMKPLNFEYIYNETPGYATTGKFVREGFDGGDFVSKIFNMDCLIKNILYAAIVTTLIYCMMGKPLAINEIALLSIVTSMARCILF